MRIKQLTIRQFGGLRDKTLTWQEGLNVISAPNEWGKTTVAEFIKMMLYGQGKAAKNIRDNQRKRFMPWGETTMGGELTFTLDGTDYTLTRTFGVRKSGDKVSAVSTVTGQEIKEWCVDAPGEQLLGVGPEGFEKTLFIRQLSTKIEPEKDDEILNKLVNLAQSGDENASFQRAQALLDAAVKELTGTRPRGRIPQLQQQLTDLYAARYQAREQVRQQETIRSELAELERKKDRLERAEYTAPRIDQAKELYAQAQRQQQQAETERMADGKRRKSIWLTIGALCVLAAIGLFLWKAPAALLGLAGAAVCVWLALRPGHPEEAAPSSAAQQLMTFCSVSGLDQVPAAIKKMEAVVERQKQRHTAALVETARRTGELQTKLESLLNQSNGDVEEQIEQVNEEIQHCQSRVDDLIQAKQALTAAFEELQGQFGVRLNDETGRILSAVTGGRYTQVAVDDSYHMTVREGKTGRLIDAQYLSAGAYDQIYFSLRMALANLLLPKGPLILDDAFCQYDDQRLQLAMDYLRSTDRQILLFTCQRREQQL